MVYVIDSVVGGGKSTLANKIHKKLNKKFYEELSNEDTYILLEKFYQNQKRWSFTLQIHFLNERFKMIKEIHKNGGGILDRSIFGDRIFAELLHEDGMMTKEEFNTYNTLLDNMLEHSKNPNLLIYIDCDVDTAIERIKNRNRKMELKVPRGYWERLNKKYDEWYYNYDISNKIKIDAKSYHPDNEEDINEIVKIIKNNVK